MYRILGILLLVFGGFALAYQGFTYTTREKVIDVGPIKVSQEKEHTVPVAPILGGAAMVAGAILLVSSKRGQ
ncbi:MAG TPA: DUF3185 domain-containing protein [Planctomycetota bacterium]|jgi:hypothetical protein